MGQNPPKFPDPDPPKFPDATARTPVTGMRAWSVSWDAYGSMQSVQDDAVEFPLPPATSE